MSEFNNLEDLERVSEKLKILGKKRKDLLTSSHKKEENLDEFKKLNAEIKREIWRIYLHWEKKLKIENYVFAIFKENYPYARDYALNQAVLNLDSLTKSQLKSFTENDEFFEKILRIWREYIDSLDIMREYDIEGNQTGMTKLMKNKILIYNKVQITRNQSIEAMKKIILREYKKIEEFILIKKPILFINTWDFDEIIPEIRGEIKIENIYKDFEMFPGEFRIQSSPELEILIHEFEKNKFIFNLWKIANFHNNSMDFRDYGEILHIFRPREFCAPNNFNRSYRNIRENCCFYIWYLFKKFLLFLGNKIDRWNASFALIIGISTLIIKLKK